MNSLTHGLTDAQREAVEHIDGPLLVLAGPGSGKTRVVTHRIANLLRQGVAPRHVVALTFTNKAADEMRGRIEQLGASAGVWVSTFHRFCARLLRQYASLVGLEENFTIYDTEDSLAALKRVLGRAEFDLRYTPEQILRTISTMKNRLASPDDVDPRLLEPREAAAARVYPDYRQLLLRSNAVDFDDLLLHTATLLADHPEVRAELDERFRYVLVDEYQDTNHAQYAIVRALCRDYPNLAVTGDPDQSIYGWRGANLSNILDFEHDYPDVKIVRLEQNYRSTPEILRVAATLIEHNSRRKSKQLFTDNPSGAPVSLTFDVDNRMEAERIADYIATEVRAGRRRLSDFAVFYRVNALSRAFESAFRQRGIGYQVLSGLEFFQRKEIKDVLAYLQLLNNPRDDQALSRIINVPPRGIGKTTLERLRAHADDRGVPMLEAARAAGLVESLSKRAALMAAKFVTMFDELSLLVSQPVAEIVKQVLTKSGYREHLKEADESDATDRVANVEELITAASEYDMRHPHDGSLEGFLEQVSLVNDTDVWEDSSQNVALMTLHAAKGLEFPVVFIVALEEGLLPHERSRHDPGQCEEERRLLFVGLTRAREELHLSLTSRRNYRGVDQAMVPSSFLLELPREEMNWRQPGVDSPLDIPPAVPRRPRRPPASQLRPSLLTAAQLAAGQPSQPRTPPEAFYAGQRVTHPEFGPGWVEEIGGNEYVLQATVNFDSPAGRKKFVLAHCALQPADPADLPDEVPEN